LLSTYTLLQRYDLTQLEVFHISTKSQARDGEDTVSTCPSHAGGRVCHITVLRPGILTAAEFTEDMDDDLFQWILWDKNHILHALLSDQNCVMNSDHKVVIVNMFPTSAIF